MDRDSVRSAPRLRTLRAGPQRPPRQHRWMRGHHVGHAGVPLRFSLAKMELSLASTHVGPLQCGAVRWAIDHPIALCIDECWIVLSFREFSV